MAKDTKMKTIEERAEEFGKRGCGENCIFICEEWKDKNGVCRRLASRVALYKSIATEQRAIDEESYTEEMRKLNEEWEENLKLQRELFIKETCEWLKANVNTIYWAVESPVSNMKIGDYVAKLYRDSMEEE